MEHFIKKEKLSKKEKTNSLTDTVLDVYENVSNGPLVFKKSEKFDWLQDSKDDTYFVFANEMRKPMPAGSQAWNCYGNRSNFFLLVNYGFCF